MARLHLNTFKAVFVLMASLWGMARPCAAAPSASDTSRPASDVQDVPDVPDGRRSYAQSAYAKMRTGYNLGGPGEVGAPADTRGELALKRDTWVQQHYRHMAEIDVLSDAALRNHDIPTAERAEALRRRDNQRFMLQMQSLRRLLLKQQAEMGP